MNQIFTLPMLLAFLAGVLLSASVKSVTSKAKAKL